ncbi:hypothetical protein EG329_008913 [Mollisiaceae sp. DMI_Dod_QoI]|nr:hypothetical protein EG329_008913 [Helotiales sp. DMI_Dod_QoI]
MMKSSQACTKRVRRLRLSSSPYGGTKSPSRVAEAHWAWGHGSNRQRTRQLSPLLDTPGAHGPPSASQNAKEVSHDEPDSAVPIRQADTETLALRHRNGPELIVSVSE